MKNLIVFSLMMFASVFAFAQRGGNAEARIQKKVDRLTTQLNLSEEQQAEVTTLMTKQQESRMAKGKRRQDMTEEQKATFKAERKADRVAFDEGMKAILTADQQELYAGMKDKSEGKMKAKGKGKKGKAMKKSQRKSPEQRAEKKVAKLTEDLNLSPAQQEQMTALMLSRDKVKKPSKKGSELTTEERDAIKAERKAEKAAYKTKFESILTSEQLATYEKLKGERKEDKKDKKRGRKIDK
ncbi:MAG: hypothetical protein AB8F74_14490 [Saprospiraceae bacterium]